MPDWLKHALEWLKTPAHYFLPVLAASGFGLFAPLCALEFLGIESWRVEGKAYLGSSFVLSAAIVLCHYGAVSLRWLWRQYRLLRLKRIAIARLKSLTREEKELLAGYLEGETRVRYFSIDDGIVAILVQQNVLQLVLRQGDVTEFPFQIVPWAWDYLHRNPRLVVVQHVCDS